MLLLLVIKHNVSVKFPILPQLMEDSFEVKGEAIQASPSCTIWFPSISSICFSISCSFFYNYKYQSQYASIYTKVYYRRCLLCTMLHNVTQCNFLFFHCLNYQLNWKIELSVQQLEDWMVWSFEYVSDVDELRPSVLRKTVCGGGVWRFDNLSRSNLQRCILCARKMVYNIQK